MFTVSVYPTFNQTDITTLITKIKEWNIFGVIWIFIKKKSSNKKFIYLKYKKKLGQEKLI